MARGNEIELAFRERGVMRGGILLLRAADALALIDAARQKQVHVLGVDGFRLGPSVTQPLMEHALDLSAVPDRADNWQTANDFIRRQDPELFFEIVLSD